ncbi:MAG: peptide chain release factor N(5)-glutamine methyltransferase [Clostridia bacterium]|nr:peptide chain release factor N(5)-glutamine methyltransferase [Clostridia bacterium]
MTYRELYRQIMTSLQNSGVSDARFDASCLLEDIGGLPFAQRARYWDEYVPEEIRFEVEEATAQRMAGRPLQYILKNWDFLALTLRVGEGVLIPRSETELLCEIGARFLKKSKVNYPKVWDLCAGSGCVGLGICTLHNEAHVTAIELSEAACYYLRYNVASHPECNIDILQADVLHDANSINEIADLILCNPPYIRSSEMIHLQREVKHEPRMALDGSEDGLIFYRELAKSWSKKLSDGGMIAVEIGEDQAEAVTKMFEKAGLTDIRVYKDAAGLDRVVSAIRR